MSPSSLFCSLCLSLCEVSDPGGERLALIEQTTSTLVYHPFNSNADHRLHLPWANISVSLCDLDFLPVSLPTVVLSSILPLCQTLLWCMGFDE